MRGHLGNTVSQVVVIDIAVIHGDTLNQSQVKVLSTLETADLGLGN